MIIPPTPAPAHAEGSIYRLKRGTKLSEIPPQPPNPSVPDLSSLNGPFQLAEYLSLKVRADPHDVRGLVDVPSGDKSVGGKGPDKDVWIYEHMRRIPIDLTPLVTALLPICNPTTCPEMKADEWLYLCSAHGGGAEQCSAIDYILHTLESTTGILNDPHNFPSRMQIPQASISRFPSLFRRLSRIFSHAYYHHRETFSLAEAETSLYARFLGLCEKYDLVGSNLLPIPRSAIVIPKEEEGDDGEKTNEDDDGEGGEGSSEEEEEEDSGRGRGESAPIERRTQSLDRSLPPTATESSQVKSAPKPEHSSTSTSAADDTSSPEKEILHAKGKTIGRGTLGRGKQPRATMEWAKPTAQSESSEPVPALPTSSTPKSPSKGRDRSESIESAIHIPSLEPPPEAVQDGALESLDAEIPELASETTADAQPDKIATTEEDTPEEVAEEVPKDEIELLEEEGKLKPQDTVAPLAPPSQSEAVPVSENENTSGPSEPASEGASVQSASGGAKTDQDGKEDMVDVELNEPTPSGSTTEESVNEAISTEMTSSLSSSAGSASTSKKDKKLSPLRDKAVGSPAPSPIKGKGKPSAAEVVKSDPTAAGKPSSPSMSATTAASVEGESDGAVAGAADAKEGK
ncbi:hypothetical protein IAU59_005166 [Kwoniella sp. CBS 9459]